MQQTQPLIHLLKVSICHIRVQVQPVRLAGSWRHLTGSRKEAILYFTLILIHHMYIRENVISQIKQISSLFHSITLYVQESHTLH